MFWSRKEQPKKKLTTFKPRFESLEERLEMSADLVNFIVPQDSDVYFQAVGGSAGANTDFGIGVRQEDAQYLLQGLPNIPSTVQPVFAGTFEGGTTIHFAMLTHWQHQDYFATTAVADRNSLEAFTDRTAGNLSLVQVGADRWRLSMDDAASQDDDDNDIIVEIHLVAKPPAPAIPETPPPANDPDPVVVDPAPVSDPVVETPADPPVSIPDPVVLEPTNPDPSPEPEVSVPPVVETPIDPPVTTEPVSETPPDPVVPPPDNGHKPDKVDAVVDPHPENNDPGPVVSVPQHVVDNPKNAIEPLIPVSTSPIVPTTPVPVDMVHFVMPYDAVLYVRFVSSDAGAINIFGTGTTSTNFNPLLTVKENQASQVGYVKVAEFKAGTVVPFAIDSKYGGSQHYAFSIGTDAVSKEAFSDTNNSMKLGGTILQQTGNNKWRLSLDDGWTGDDDDNDLVIDIKLIR